MKSYLFFLVSDFADSEENMESVKGSEQEQEIHLQVTSLTDVTHALIIHTCICVQI